MKIARKRKKVLLEKNSKSKNVQLFFFTVYRVHGVVVSGNFSRIREYSSTVLN
jgi:hypothetical protein